MSYRLLVDLEAITILDALPKTVRARVVGHLAKLRLTPKQYSDYAESDSTGRRVEISIVAGHAIHYWIDDADRHIKVLAIEVADR